MTNNDLQNITEKTKSRNTPPTEKRTQVVQKVKQWDLLCYSCYYPGYKVRKVSSRVFAVFEIRLSNLLARKLQN
jgi:hypothetical protein